MKTDRIIKHKIAHSSSFISNSELLECIRNKSFKISRNNSKKSLNTNSILIKKKSYENFHHPNKENMSMIFNHNQSVEDVNLETGKTDRIENVIFILQDCLESMPEGMQKIKYKIKKALENIRSIKEEKQKAQLQQKITSRQKENENIILIENLNQQKENLRKENNVCNKLIQELTEKYNTLKKKYKEKEITSKCQEKETAFKFNSNKTEEKDPLNLQKIIISQSELINKKCQEHKQESLDYKFLLQSQALQIEQMLLLKQKINPVESQKFKLQLKVKQKTQKNKMPQHNRSAIDIFYS